MQSHVDYHVRFLMQKGGSHGNARKWHQKYLEYISANRDGTLLCKSTTLDV